MRPGPRTGANVRLRFIGYTGDERLDRRTAAIYGDDIGLSTARARRAMAAVCGKMGLREDQAEFEGRGYVQSDDVVNAGFIESDTSRVEVQVVYDERRSARRLRGGGDHAADPRGEPGQPLRPESHAHHRRRQAASTTRARASRTCSAAPTWPSTVPRSGSNTTA